MYLQLKDIEFSYEDFKILDKVNINVEPRKFISILGSNGSGKSTLNSIISGLLAPDSGELVYNDITKDDVYLVFQNPDYQFIKPLVKEELSFGLENKGIEVEEIKKKINYFTKALRIDNLLDKYTFELSGGEKQKVMLCAILLLEPKVLILDEAMEMLDEKSKDLFMVFMEKIRYENDMSIVSVTHKMDDAALTDYIYVLNNGKITIKGTPQEVFSNKNLIFEARLEVPLTYSLSQSAKCNYDVFRDINKFKEYYNDKI